MALIGSKSGKGRRRRRRRVSTPEEDYETLTQEQLRLNSQIRNLEGFIDEAPQIREERLEETRVTLPPLEDGAILPEPVVAFDDGELEDDHEEHPQERFGRRHLAAMRRARRKNFLIFLVSVAAVAWFLFWVSQVVR